MNARTALGFDVNLTDDAARQRRLRYINLKLLANGVQSLPLPDDSGAAADAERLLAIARTVCIGSSTAEQLMALGRTADLMPETYTIDGMIDKMVNG